MEASYFYYRPSDLIWVNGIKGHDLDKGFNVKLIHRIDKFSSIAIGLDDIAGTGYFSKEYLVSKKRYDNLSLSLGIGWGKFNGENTFSNPLSYISENFDIRPGTDFTSFGGTPATSSWFKGDASLFGGIEYHVPKIAGLKLKLEYDPFDYMDLSALKRVDANFDKRKKDSKLNIGLSYGWNKFLTIDTSYIKGNTFNITFSFALSLKEELFTKKKFEPAIVNTKTSEDSFYEDLLKNLNKNKLLLQTASLEESNLNLSISTSEHRNAIRSSSYAAYIANSVAKIHDININSINVSHINVGIELNNISYLANHLREQSKTPIELIIRNTTIESGKNNGYKEHQFQPKIIFPVIFSSTSPVILSHIGNPEKFYYGGVNLQNISEIQFNRNIILSSELNYSIYNNFKDSFVGPSSQMQHVRTDLIQYLKEDNFFISRMQLDYIQPLSKNIYGKVSAGIFESMYGGIGGQLLFRPHNKKYDIGAEIFYVKQRSFNQMFSFIDYSTITGHISFGYKLPKGIEANISFGRYLAKDVGYTFDLSRRLNSGFKAGFYFTRTDVPKELFGEGSFDKGFYFQIPTDLFSGDYSGNYSAFRLSPLTRDGGAKLNYDKDLRGLIYNSTYYELSRQWDGFLN